MPKLDSESARPAVAALRGLLAELDAATPARVILHVNHDCRLLELSGQPAALGLPELQAGSDAGEVLLFLPGADMSAPAQWPCLDVGTGHAVDAYLRPDEAGGCYVVLVSVEEQRRQRAGLQQTANEQQLANQRQQRLLDRLVETRSELDLRRREAEEALRAKSQFIASMSHEFRTPLTSVLGYAEWLAASLADPARRQARAIVRAGRHMIALVDNLLEQARLQRQDARAREDVVDLRAVAEDLSAIMAPLAADKSIAYAAFVESGVPAAIVVDEMRLRQILINLVGNAVKFTDAGFVNVVLDWQGGQLFADIIDSGPGIEEQDQVRIFSAFERLGGAHLRAGAGLGLHITLQLVKLLGGSLDLDSRPGEGSRFRVRLPAAMPGDERQPDEAQREVEAGGRLLIAEDDADIAQLMELYLGRAGYELCFVTNGRDAVDRAREIEPDLVLLDINMPVLDGFGAVRELREGGYTGAVIALTGAAFDHERLHAADSGFDGVVAKPIRMPELLAYIRGLIE